MASKPGFDKLLEPFSIGRMSLKNRLVMPPMVTFWGTEEGQVTQRTKDFYEERARGGVGLIIVEATCVDSPIGKQSPGQLVIDDDRFIPGLAELARVIQKHGARCGIQLTHGGRDIHPSRGTEAIHASIQPVSASAIASPGGELPRELTVAEIKEIVRRFAEAALRAKRAGFDGVEVHGAHSYLIASFLSPHYNRRQDGYGGELRNRARLLLEVLRATRERVGPDYPVWCRLNAVEYGIEDGATLEEAQQVARMAQEAGADAINVTAFGTTNVPMRLGARPNQPGSQVPLAEGIKKAVSIPVMAVGRMGLELGEKVLQEGKADLIAIGRALIADPEFIAKTISGRSEDITPCIACNACLDSLNKGEGLRCAVNAAVGKEREYRIRPAEKRRRVLVIGGGPAGMEASRAAALRGHQVVLYEKQPQLGGQLLLAAMPPHKQEIELLTSYLATQISKLGVKVELGKEADPATVERVKPDVVVLASGVTPFIPDIPGIDRANVVRAEAVLTGEVGVGNRVVVMGGERVGCETAEFLADKGKEVTITRRGPALVETMVGRGLLLERLAQKGVAMLPGVKYEQITDTGLVIADREGARRTIEADTIVLATGARPNNELSKALNGKAPQTYLAGDCLQPRTIMEAIADGSRIARAI